jgi:hypothetical protein
MLPVGWKVDHVRRLGHFGSVQVRVLRFRFRRIRHEMRGNYIWTIKVRTSRDVTRRVEFKLI